MEVAKSCDSQPLLAGVWELQMVWMYGPLPQITAVEKARHTHRKDAFAPQPWQFTTNLLI